MSEFRSLCFPADFFEVSFFINNRSGESELVDILLLGDTKLNIHNNVQQSCQHKLINFPDMSGGI